MAGKTETEWQHKHENDPGDLDGPSILWGVLFVVIAVPLCMLILAMITKLIQGQA